jgi:hypothetical protein
LNLELEDRAVTIVDTRLIVVKQHS